MNKSKLLNQSLVAAVLLAIIISATACSSSGFDSKVKSVTDPYRFSLLGWEAGAISNDIWQSITIHESPDRSDLVIAYFDAIQAGKTQTADGTPVDQLRPRVEKIIQSQVRTVVSELGIDNPFDNFLGIRFPPMSFVLSKPPNLLVISPEDKIEILKEVRLKPEVFGSQIESIESQTDKLGVSSLVVGLGGIATFPTFVSEDMPLPDILNDVAHEWMHTYLVFKPLGFRYVLDLLGIAPSYDIVTINETVAGIFGDEVGPMVYNKYYATYLGPLPEPSMGTSTFDFNATMRQIRLTIDTYLAEGRVTEAEQYMNYERDFLQSRGYFIRKLNQAYFAFYGTYASSPTSVSPIGKKIAEVRTVSPSIKAFIATMSGVTSLQQLDRLHSP